MTDVSVSLHKFAALKSAICQLLVILPAAWRSVPIVEAAAETTESTDARCSPPRLSVKVTYLQ